METWFCERWHYRTKSALSVKMNQWKKRKKQIFKLWLTQIFGFSSGNTSTLSLGALPSWVQCYCECRLLWLLSWLEPGLDLNPWRTRSLVMLGNHFPAQQVHQVITLLFDSPSYHFKSSRSLHFCRPDKHASPAISGKFSRQQYCDTTGWQARSPSRPYKYFTGLNLFVSKSEVPFSPFSGHAFSIKHLIKSEWLDTSYISWHSHHLLIELRSTVLHIISRKDSHHPVKTTAYSPSESSWDTRLKPMSIERKKRCNKLLTRNPSRLMLWILYELQMVSESRQHKIPTRQVANGLSLSIMVDSPIHSILFSRNHSTSCF